MKRLILIRGVPGSGKTTLARMLGWEHFENDQYFERPDGTYAYDPSEVRAAAESCMARTLEAMGRGVDIVVANTFSRSWEYIPYHEAAAAHGYSVQMVVCQGDFGSIHDIPTERMERFRRDFHYESESVKHSP